MNFFEGGLEYVEPLSPMSRHVRYAESLLRQRPANAVYRPYGRHSWVRDEVWLRNQQARANLGRLYRSDLLGWGSSIGIGALSYASMLSTPHNIDTRSRHMRVADLPETSLVNTDPRSRPSVEWSRASNPNDRVGRYPASWFPSRVGPSGIENYVDVTLTTRVPWFSTTLTNMGGYYRWYAQITPNRAVYPMINCEHPGGGTTPVYVHTAERYFNEFTYAHCTGWELDAVIHPFNNIVGTYMMAGYASEGFDQGMINTPDSINNMTDWASQPSGKIYTLQAYAVNAAVPDLHWHFGDPDTRAAYGSHVADSDEIDQKYESSMKKPSPKDYAVYLAVYANNVNYAYTPAFDFTLKQSFRFYHRRNFVDVA